LKLQTAVAVLADTKPADTKPADTVLAVADYLVIGVVLVAALAPHAAQRHVLRLVATVVDRLTVVERQVDADQVRLAQ
jgi:hypothetical protein